MVTCILMLAPQPPYGLFKPYCSWRLRVNLMLIENFSRGLDNTAVSKVKFTASIELRGRHPHCASI